MLFPVFCIEERQGSYNCITWDVLQKPHVLPFAGMRFGLMQTKVGIISLLSKYEVRFSEKTPVPLEFEPRSVALAPRGGMWLQIVKRSYK
jgi:hypothetical protein